MPSCNASAACSFECQCPVSAGSKSFNLKCLPLSTRKVLAILPVFIRPLLNVYCTTRYQYWNKLSHTGQAVMIGFAERDLGSARFSSAVLAAVCPGEVTRVAKETF